MNETAGVEKPINPRPWVEVLVRVVMVLLGLFEGALGVGVVILLMGWPWFFKGMFTNFNAMHAEGLNLVGFAAAWLLSGVAMVVLGFGMRQICPRWPRLSLAAIWLMPVSVFALALMGFGISLFSSGVEETLGTYQSPETLVWMMGITIFLTAISLVVTKISKKYRVRPEGEW